MVSVGTIISIAVIGTIAAAGYAVYRNADKIGGALSRGVEGYFTNPLGKYFEDLFRNLPTTAAGAGPGTPLPTLDPNAPVQTSGPLIGFEGGPAGPQLPADKNLIQTQFDIWFAEKFGAGPLAPKPDVPKITDVTPPGPIPQSIPASQAGYYYFNYPGSKYDFQAKLGLGEADLYKKTDVGPQSFTDLVFLGISKLTPAGLQTFGKSQNYL